jgi:hypothetical protein
MTNHLKVYCAGLSIEPEEVVCELTGRPAAMGGVDIHHIEPRGMGGSKSKDYLENLMAVDRRLHDFVENNPKYQHWYRLVHFYYLYTRIPYTTTHGCDPVWEEILAKMK